MARDASSLLAICTSGTGRLINGLEHQNLLSGRVYHAMTLQFFLLLAPTDPTDHLTSPTGTYQTDSLNNCLHTLLQDMFTSMTSASKPHHVVDANGVVLGYSHFGMLASARWIKGEVAEALRAARLAEPGFSLTLVGHSMGAGTAAMVTMM